ncbi:MAG: dual specificity protein phosphatase family protein, partial [archaeon]|nr:dual specificity protein phosphatase family protein [archaeon]
AIWPNAGFEENFHLEGTWHNLLNLMSRPVRRLFSRAVSFPIALVNRLLSALGIGGPWWSQITDEIYLGAMPFLPGDVELLHQLGVRYVVNTCDEWRSPVDTYDYFGIQHLYIPVIDASPPTMGDIVRAIDFLDRADPQAKIFIHCRAGRGRSTTILMCYLMHRNKWSRTQTQDIIAAHRQISSNVCNRPIVVQFEQLMKENQDLHVVLQV